MRFLVESSFNQSPTNEILALIPAETARGLELDQQGIRKALYLAADQSRAWQVLVAESQAAVQAVMESFPLFPYLNVTITPLAEEPGG